MRRDFTTARNHIVMKWNPQGYWISQPGAFIGNGDSKSVCAAYTQTELSRGKIPQGYRFAVNEAKQYIVSNGSVGKPATVPASTPATAAAPPVTEPSPAPASKTAPPADPPRSAVPAPVPPAQSQSPIAENSPPIAGRTVTPSMRSAILDPVHARTAAPDPAPGTTTEQPPGPTINGVPAEMQKSFLSKHYKRVFLMFDREAGKWRSSEGAIKDAGTIDQWCKEATVVDRHWKNIPADFSYKSAGNGQVEATRD